MTASPHHVSQLMEDSNGRAVVVSIDEAASTVTLMLPRYTAEELAARKAELAARAAAPPATEAAPAPAPAPVTPEATTPPSITFAVSGQTEEAYTVVATASPGLDVAKMVIAVDQPAESEDLYTLRARVGEVSNKVKVRRGGAVGGAFRGDDTRRGCPRAGLRPVSTG